ncbi:MAG: hypothetical protein IID33_03840, partial [Planctomycetes bacterium]|nr:hypothetical protein [Planctomycetota bacterium]
MALKRHRSLAALTFLAAYPLAIFVATAGAEDRKFVLFLADPSKDHEGSTLQLPKRTDIWDAYFDKVKNGQDDGIRVDSFAEWWEEVSYGDVTVSGEVFGWVSVPWPTSPPGFDGDSGFGSTSVIPHVELQGGFSYQPGSGERFSNGATMFEYDWDGVGEDFNRRNQAAFRFPGFGDEDNFNRFRLWAPGERFVDLNGNGDYDAGVFEWGIDKNGNGRIDIDLSAGSFAELFAATINYPPDNQDDPPLFVQWNRNGDGVLTEWFDANGDGVWNQDNLWDDGSGEQRVYQREFFPLDPSVGGGTRPIDFYRGDWGGRELWIDKDGDFEVGGRATQDDRFRGDGNANDDQPAAIWEWMFQVNDPEDDSVEYYDEQWNDNFDFPEPFEDYMRSWSAGSHNFIRTSEDYIRANYPGDAEGLIARIGNGRYDSPDRWRNSGEVVSTNKMQEVRSRLLDQAEAAEQQSRFSFNTGRGRFGAEPLWCPTF